LSSVAVYGDFPSPDASDETTPTGTQRGTYGWIKLRQDNMIQKAATRGLASVILCPPNIFGPGSYFLVQLLDCLIKGEFLLIRDEDCVCCTVDVGNLAHACLVALESQTSDGRRYFVTDDEVVTWPRLLKRLSSAGGLETEVPTCSRAELTSLLPRFDADKSG